MTEEANNFLFVDESNAGDAPQGYKVGYRPDIRSHIRKRTAKQFQKQHKTALKQKRVAGKCAPLDSQHDELLDREIIHETANNQVGEASGSGVQWGQMIQPEEGTAVVARDLTRQAPSLSPLELLGSGRVDPFSSYPVELSDRVVHELMDFGG